MSKKILGSGSTLLIIFASLSISALLAPTGLSQAPASSDVEIPDDEGDVSPQPGTAGYPVTATTDGVDITKVRFFGETGEHFKIAMGIKDLDAEATYYQAAGVATGGVAYAVCFNFRGKAFAAVAWVAWPAVVASKVGVVDGGCKQTGVRTWSVSGVEGARVLMDVENSQLIFTVKKAKLGQLIGEGLPTLGEAITDLYAVVADQKDSSAGAPPGLLRYDAAPDAGPGDDKFTFTFGTANDVIKMVPDANVRFAPPCGENPDFMTYAIEAGGKRGVPVIVSNPLEEARVMKFEVLTSSGAEWNAKVMPSITVPAATPEKLGNITINVIVDTPAGTKHKDCSTLLIRGIDANDPGIVAETSINVIAAQPLTREVNKLYLHGNRLATTSCAWDNVWMNPLEQDLDAAEPPIHMMSCGSSNTLFASADPAAIGFQLDLNPSRDLVLNSTVTGKSAAVKLNIKNDYGQTKAKFTGTLLTLATIGSDVIGEYTTEPMTLAPNSATTVEFDMPIFFTREAVAEGDPSRIVDARSKLLFQVRYEPLPLDNDLSQIKPAGAVALVTEGSSLTLPIWDSLKRGVNDPGVTGALLSLSALTDTDLFANPGNLRVFNLTVLNEGVASDVAVISTTVSPAGAPWTVTVAPPGPFTLGPGESRQFSVGVTPGVDVKESELARIEIVATSQSDDTARSNVLLTVTATKGQVLPSQSLDVGPKEGGKGGGLPAPGLPLLALAIAAVGLVLWRRRAN